MQSRVTSIGFIFGALTLLGGCELIAAVDRSLLDDNTGGGGNPTTGGGGSGAGGATGGGGTGGTGGTGATGGTGGTGGGPECETAEQCPNPAVCATRACNGGMCEEGFEAADTACTDGALMGICDGDGNCVECLDNMDCTAPDTCDLATNVCVAPGCMNGMMDNDETDTDCGGSCSPCMNMDSCLVDGDCTSGFCNGAMTCAACTGPADCDGTQYCGAGICTTDKMNGQACTVAETTGDATGNSQCPNNQCNVIGDGTRMCCNSDCSGGCRSCAAADGASANGMCGDVTNATDPKMACAAAGCATTGVCQAGACEAVPNGMDPNNFCAATGCATTGACQAGACEAVSNGTDPNNFCADLECTTGNCNAGACQNETPGTNCGMGPTCVGDDLSPQDTCGGAVCDAGMLIDCGFYTCNTTSCFTTCTAQNQCATGAYCILLTAMGTQMTCADKKATGACNEDFECEDGSCTLNLCE